MKHTHNRPRRRRTDVCPNPYDDLYFSQLAQEILQGDEGGKLVTLGSGQGGAEQDVQLLPNDAGGRLHDVLERLVFSVNVRDEMFGALGQVEDGLEIDDLRAGGLNGGVLLGQHFQVVQVLRPIGDFFGHDIRSFQIRATPVRRAASATAAETAGQTRGAIGSRRTTPTAPAAAAVVSDAIVAPTNTP